jgi:hypothetical protein
VSLTPSPADTFEAWAEFVAAHHVMPARQPPRGRVGLTGCGDSLAACLLAGQDVHPVLSAGDLAWRPRHPDWCDTVIGVSQSGNTGATVEALRVARRQGFATLAITMGKASTLAAEADQVCPVEPASMPETVPAAGYLGLGLAVLDVCGLLPDDAPALVAEALRGLAADGVPLSDLPGEAPASVSVLSLSDTRSAGDFWSLKFIEATGVAARSVPLEESGHVDYFIGPQRHLTVVLLGSYGRRRAVNLAAALRRNGQLVMAVDTQSLPVAGLWQRYPLLGQLPLAACGAVAAQAAAVLWARPPFRGGEVPMDAAHIKVHDGESV